HASSDAQGRRIVKEESLTERLARMTKINEKDSEKFLRALGPAIIEDLANGKTVTIAGLGSFRVVQVPAHKDLAPGGRPVMIPASNSVQFLPAKGIDDAANAPGAKPVEVVPPFEYNPLPNQTPGQKSPRNSTPATRTKS